MYCGWCQNKGCAACFNKRQEMDRDYDRQFPNGPQPIFTARLDDAEEMEQAKRVIHRSVLEKAFGPGGGGIQEIIDRASQENERRKVKREE